MGTVKYSGPIASFHCPTNAEIRSLKVHFSPKQLGEGDPSPENVREIEGWDGVEAYQTGKNIWDEEWELGYLNTSTGVNAATSSQIRAKNYIKLLPNTTYYVKYGYSGGAIWAIFFDQDKKVISDYAFSTLRSANVFGVPNRNFTTPSNCYFMRFYCTASYGTTYRNDIAVCIASTATPYEPYHGSTTNYEFGVLGKNKYPLTASTAIENIKTGYNNTIVRDVTSTSIYQNVSANNYWIGSTTSSYISNVGNGEITFSSSDGSYGAGMFVPVTPKQTYIISSNSEKVRFRVGYYNDNGTFSGQHFIANKAFTIPAEYHYAFIVVVPLADYYNQEITVSNIQLELGSTATTYEPYNPNHTVYGGWVDLISGEVCEEYGLLEINNTCEISAPTSVNEPWNHRWSIRKWNSNTSKWFFKTNTNILYCDRLNKVSSATKNGEIYGVTVEGRIYLYDDEITTVEEFHTKYDDMELCAPINEPYNTYHLAPTQLQTFLGQNNIWSNADYVEVEYDLHETQDILARKQFIIANQPHTVKASGSLVNFETDMAAALKECKVGFKPVQDLHGYDKPWVGGSGKNLFDENDITYGKWTEGGGNVVNNAPYGVMMNNQIFIPAGTTVYLTIFGDTVYSKGIVFYNTDGTFNSRAYSNGTGQITYTVAIDCYMAAEIANIPGETITEEYVKAAKVVLSIGSAATAYEPYENICPISGWTELEVTRCGKNFSTAATGTEMAQKWPIISSGSSRTLELSGLEPGQEFTLSASFTKASEPSSNKRLYLVGSQKANSTSNSIFTGPSADGPVNRVIHNWVDTDGTIRITHNNRGLTYNDDFIEYAASLQNIQLELGDTATAFEPYNGTTIPITFPSEAGTVYGGYVDLVNGELVQTWNCIRANEKTWSNYSAYQVFYTNKSDRSADSRDISNKLESYTGYGWSNAPNNSIISGNRNSMFIKHLGVSSNAEFKEWLDEVDPIVYYELAEPIHYTLTPTQLKTLRGTNNIWASNGGDNIELSYWKH